MLLAVLVAALYVVASAGYGSTKPGHGIGAVGALASRGVHVLEAEKGAADVPGGHRGPDTSTGTRTRDSARNGQRQPDH